MQMLSGVGAAKILLAALMALGFSGGVAHADETFIELAGRSVQPPGHYEFCKREPAVCGASSPEQDPIEMTPDLWQTLLDVNKAVNKSVEHRTDFEMWGVEEHWSYPDKSGDTEDFALEKQRRLMALGLPASNLMLAVVKTMEGGGHAPLVVRTTKGDFVLGDMETDVLPWNETKYLFFKLQLGFKPRVWLSAKNGCTPAYAAIKACE